MTDYQRICEINALLNVAAGLLRLAHGSQFSLDQPLHNLPQGLRPVLDDLLEAYEHTQKLIADHERKPVPRTVKSPKRIDLYHGRSKM